MGFKMGLYSRFYATHWYPGTMIFDFGKLKYFKSGSLSWILWLSFFSFPVWLQWSRFDLFIKILLDITLSKAQKKPKKNSDGSLFTVRICQFLVEICHRFSVTRICLQHNFQAMFSVHQIWECYFLFFVGTALRFVYQLISDESSINFFLDYNNDIHHSVFRLSWISFTGQSWIFGYNCNCAFCVFGMSCWLCFGSSLQNFWWRKMEM